MAITLGIASIIKEAPHHLLDYDNTTIIMTKINMVRISMAACQENINFCLKTIKKLTHQNWNQNLQ